MSFKKFTFKTEQPTGRYRSFFVANHNIKYEGKWVGDFVLTEKGWCVSIMIMKTEVYTDNNPNCPWKWIRFRSRHESLEAAKLWINSEETRKYIHDNFTLYLGD